MRLRVLIYTLTLFGLFLTSCAFKNNGGGNNGHGVQQRSIADERLLAAIREQEARFDVAFPRVILPIPSLCAIDVQASSFVMIGFESEDSLDNLVLFYKRSMEHWRRIKYFSGPERLLIYTRPDKMLCTISLRPHPIHANNSLLLMTIGKKDLHG